MIKPESSEITEDEILLRRVKYLNKFDKGLKLGAFSPTPDNGLNNHPDIDGISLFRLACLENEMDILQHFNEEDKLYYGIVGISCKEVKSIEGLDVVNKPMDASDPRRINGHVVIPQMNCYQDAGRLASLKYELIEFAKCRIYLKPSK